MYTPPKLWPRCKEIYDMLNSESTHVYCSDDSVVVHQKSPAERVGHRMGVGGCACKVTKLHSLPNREVAVPIIFDCC